MFRLWTWFTGGPNGRLLWWQLAAEILVLLICTWAVYSATGSGLFSAAPMYVVPLAFRPVHRRAARLRPLPPYPDPPPPKGLGWRGALFCTAWIGITLALILGSASVAHRFMAFEPGPWFWFSLWFLGPLMIVGNYCGTQPPHTEKLDPDDVAVPPPEGENKATM